MVEAARQGGLQVGDLVSFLAREVRIFGIAAPLLFFGDRRIPDPSTVLHLTLELTRSQQRGGQMTEQAGYLATRRKLRKRSR
jgi:hypothetical protein